MPERRNTLDPKSHFNQHCRAGLRIRYGASHGRIVSKNGGIATRGGLPQLRGVALAGVAALLAACGNSGPATEKAGPSDEISAAAADSIEAGAEGIGTSHDETAPNAPETASAEDAAIATTSSRVKLYALDCGTIEVSDLDIFSDAGDYAGQQDVFTNTCFLIRHPDGDLIWDFGLSADLVGAEPVTNGPFTLTLEKTIETQLMELELTPTDIEFVAFSHSHFDHVSQFASFPEATFIVNPTELDHMVSEAQSNEDMATLLRLIEGMEKRYVDDPGGEHDVFGDGTVGMFLTPGHTPGHMALLVTLDKAGPVLLTGDLYHRKESRQLGRVPRFNTDPEMTREAMALFEFLAQSYGARVIIQHEPEDIATLPAFPEALE